MLLVLLSRYSSGGEAAFVGLLIGIVTMAVFAIIGKIRNKNNDDWNPNQLKWYWKKEK